LSAETIEKQWRTSAFGAASERLKTFAQSLSRTTTDADYESFALPLSTTPT
jgi:hypothetical protein